MKIQIQGLFAGRAQTVTSRGSNECWDQPWESGIFKAAVSGPVWLSHGGIPSHGQADRKHHGGPDKALCIYLARHYDYWRRQPGLTDMPFGDFGENITLGGATEAELCLGDRFQLGEALVKISQPRRPCWKLSRRWRVKDLKEQEEQTGFTGCYFRVVKHGWLKLNDAGELIERPCLQWNLMECNLIMRHRCEDFAARYGWPSVRDVREAGKTRSTRGRIAPTVRRQVSRSA